MRMTITLIFITLGIPVLTTMLIFSYELLSRCFRPLTESRASHGISGAITTRELSKDTAKIY